MSPGEKLTVGSDNVYVDKLPTADGGHHAWKFLGIGPGALYLPTYLSTFLPMYLSLVFVVQIEL